MEYTEMQLTLTF